MKQQLLPSVVALIAVAAVGLSLAMSAPGSAWLFTGERGAPLSQQQLRWWFVLLPLGLASAAIAAMTVLATLRALRCRQYLNASNAFAVGVLGVGAVATALTVVSQWRMEQRYPKPKSRPVHSSDIYLPEQWWDLATQLRDRNPVPRLRESGVGLEGYPGFIPFDPFLLKRVSFVGLTREQVTELLGPPRPPKRPWDAGEPAYFMANQPGLISAPVQLQFAKNRRGEVVVVAEYLTLHRPTP
jgi:hypothetical protein